MIVAPFFFLSESSANNELLIKVFCVQIKSKNPFSLHLYSQKLSFIMEKTTDNDSYQCFSFSCREPFEVPAVRKQSFQCLPFQEPYQAGA